MKKILIAIFILTTILLRASDYLAKGVVLADGRWLESKNIHIQHPIASLTKLMTALIVAEEVENGNVSLEDIVTIDRSSLGIAGDSINLVNGEKISLGDLLYASLIQSANNATYAIAKYIGKNEDNFVKLMNEKAKELEMNHTTFYTPAGLPSIMTKKDMDISTVEDLTKLCMYILNNEVIMNIVNLEEYSIKKNRLKLLNKNKSLKIDGVDGLKFGFHESAGYNFAISVDKNDLRYIVVLLGAKSIEEGESEIEKTVQNISDNYSETYLVHEGEFLIEVPIINGKQKTIELYASKSVYKLVRRDIQLSKTVYLPKEIQAPIEKNQVLGTYIISHENNELARIDLVSKENIEKAKWIHKIINKFKK